MGFYRSNDPTNSFKALKEDVQGSNHSQDTIMQPLLQSENHYCVSRQEESQGRPDCTPSSLTCNLPTSDSIPPGDVHRTSHFGGKFSSLGHACDVMIMITGKMAPHVLMMTKMTSFIHLKTVPTTRTITSQCQTEMFYVH